MIQTQDISLAAAQETVVKQILDAQRKAGLIKSDPEYQTLYAQYMNKITAGEPVMQPTAVSGTIDGDAMTQTLEDYNIDIMTVFSAVNTIGETISKHKMLNQSVLNAIRLQIKNAQDELETYEAQVGLQGVQGLAIQRFHDTNNMEAWDATLFTDRDGSLLAPAEMGALDADLENLKLPSIVRQNLLIGNSGVPLAQIRLVKQLGSGLISLASPAHDITKAMDDSTETFWAETILTDAPMQVEEFFPFQTSSGEQTLETRFGALAVLQIDFDYLSPISQITLTPYTTYPMELVAILYRNEENQTWTSLISPFEIEGNRPAPFRQTLSYEFPETITKHLQVILNQPHYVKTDYLVSEKQQRNLELWFAGTRETTLSLPETFKNQPTYQDQAEQQPAWAFFLEKMKKGKRSIEEVVAAFNQDQSYSLSKYQYDYGLYNVGLYRNEYANRGIYVSKSIPVTDNIKSVNLVTREYHPLVQGLSAPVTDIEYSVWNGVKWYPILPKNVTQIPCERILGGDLNGTQLTAQLRFLPVGAAVISKNRIPLAADEYQVNGWLVKILNYDSSAIYTASYTPDPAACTLNFLDFLKRGSDGWIDLASLPHQTQTYAGTDPTGALPLTYRPFVDRERLTQVPAGWDPGYLQGFYVPMVVSLIDELGTHIAQPSLAPASLVLVNKTDYFDPEQKNQLAAFDPVAGNYQYQVIGQTLRFNTVLSEGTRITVSYPYLMDDLRLKAILCRNDNGLQGLTPMLDTATLSFETML